MLIDERLEDLRNKINAKVPAGISISEVEFEGPELVIYTDDTKKFAEQADLIKILARELRKRIVVRPPNILEDPEKAAAKVRAVVPDTAGITDLFFDPDTGEVLVEAEKPGLVIGKNGGATLRDITKEIGWTAKVVRTPPIESKTVKDIRQYLRSVKDERKEFLRRIGKRIHRDVRSKDKWVRVTTLAAAVKWAGRRFCSRPRRAGSLLTAEKSPAVSPRDSRTWECRRYLRSVHWTRSF